MIITLSPVSEADWVSPLPRALPVISPSVSGSFIHITTPCGPASLWNASWMCFYYFHHDSEMWVGWAEPLSLLHPRGDGDPGRLRVSPEDVLWGAARASADMLLDEIVLVYCCNFSSFEWEMCSHCRTVVWRMRACVPRPHLLGLIWDPSTRMVLLGFNWWLLGRALLESRFPLGHCF